MTRETFGWGAGRGLAFRNHTHLEKVHGPCPIARRAKRKHRQPPSAFAVFERDCWTCQKCGLRPTFDGFVDGWASRLLRVLTVDHVIPSACGGSDDAFNLTTLCRACNTRRGAYLPNPRVLL